MFLIGRPFVDMELNRRMVNCRKSNLKKGLREGSQMKLSTPMIEAKHPDVASQPSVCAKKLQALLLRQVL